MSKTWSAKAELTKTALMHIHTTSLATNTQKNVEISWNYHMQITRMLCINTI
jgi:hypothetical protein